jgi:hypothetical protein
MDTQHESSSRPPPRSPNFRRNFIVFSPSAHQAITIAGEDAARGERAQAPSRRLRAATLGVGSRGISCHAARDARSTTHDRGEA